MSKQNTSRFAAVELLENRRLLMGGITDTSFGNEGVAFTPVDSRLPAAIARQPDGKLLVAGVQRGARYDSSNENYVGSNPLTLSRYNADGTVDTSFGPFGQKTLGEIANFAIEDFLATPDGGLLLRGVEGEQPNSEGLSVLVKLTPSGSLDSTFGAEGRIDLAYDEGDGPFFPETIRLASDGRIFVSHTLNYGSGLNVRIRAFLPTGSVDSTFADDGVLSVLTNDARGASNFALDMSGRIVVHVQQFEQDKSYICRFSPSGVADQAVGTKEIPVPSAAEFQAVLADNRMVFSQRGYDNATNAQTLELYRITVSGKLDTTFSGDGKTAVSAPRENEDPDKPLLVAPDGRIVYLWSRQLPVYVDDPFGIAVIRTNGTLDPTFGGDGVQLHDLPFSYPYSTALLQPDGKLVIPGASFDPEDFALVRYGVDGKFDKTFDKDGIVLPGPGNNLLGEFNDVKVLADGRSVAVGRTGRAGFNELLIARYTAAGALDTTFAGKGWTKLSVNKDNIATQVLVQSDGKYLVGGAGFIVRYKTDGTLDSSFASGGVLKTSFSQMQLLSDGKILLVDGGAAPKRLNINGTTDSAFAAAALPAHLLNAKFSIIEAYPGNRFLLGGVTDVDEAIENRGVLVRYHANGALDTSFSADGVAFPKATEFDLMAVRPDGGINVARNFSSTSYYDYSEYANYWTEVWQVKSNGKPDVFARAEQTVDSFTVNLGEEYFGEDAQASIDPNIGTKTLRVQPDGKMLLGIQNSYWPTEYSDNIVDSTLSNVGLRRFLPNGTVDRSFSIDGVASIIARDPAIPSQSFNPYGLAFDLAPNGAVVAVGSAKRINTVPLITRFAPDSNAPSVSDGGILAFSGTENEDIITLNQQGDVLSLDINGVTTTYAAQSLVCIVAELRGGDDQFESSESITVALRLDAGAGNDSVFAATTGMHSDNATFAARVFGGDGNDLIEGGSLQDSLNGGAGEDTLRGDGGNDLLWGGPGNDLLEGGTNSDSLYGTEGDDRIFGGNGEDALDGGEGADYLSGDAQGDSINVKDADTASGGDGDDAFFGQAARIVVMGGGGNDRFTIGAETPETVVDFQISGGRGDDVFIAVRARGAQSFIGGPGRDTANFADFSEPLTLSLDDQPNDGRAGDACNISSSVETLIGGYGDDRLTGSESDNVLVGLSGNDIIHGMGGNDTIAGDRTHDYIYNSGRDTLFGDNGNDIFVGFNDGLKDRINGGAGDDKAMREASKDVLAAIEEFLVDVPLGLPYA